MASSMLCRTFTKNRLSLAFLNDVLARTIVSNEFKLQDAWDERLKSPVFSKIDMNKYFFEIDRKFQREKRASAIDVDIFANLASNETEVEQLEELLHRFRRTPQTSSMLSSTHHATVRAFLSAGLTDNLMRVLDDRLNYGIFPDDHALVLMLDHFIVNENWRDGAKAAILMMLQEDHEVPIAREMGLYALYKYVMTNAPEPWDPQAPPPVEEPEDDVKVRVKFLKPDYFDDHFDLTEKNHLCGKSLVKLLGGGLGDPAVDRSLEVLGWALFEKWDKFSEMIGTGALAQDCVDKCRELVEEKVADEEQRNVLKEALDKVKVEGSVSVEEYLKQKSEESVAKNSASLIEKQKSILAQWNTDREKELEKQYEIYLKENRLAKLEEKKRQIKEQEERLFFYDRFDEMEMEKEEKIRRWRQTFPRRSWGPAKITLKPKEKVSDDYLPPEIKTKTSKRPSSGKLLDTTAVRSKTYYGYSSINAH